MSRCHELPKKPLPDCPPPPCSHRSAKVVTDRTRAVVDALDRDSFEDTDAFFAAALEAFQADTYLPIRDTRQLRVFEQNMSTERRRSRRSSFTCMAPRKSPTAEDRVQAIRVALLGIGAGADLGDVRFELFALHPKNNTFPGGSLPRVGRGCDRGSRRVARGADRV